MKLKSVFRYPGGKAKFIKFILPYIIDIQKNRLNGKQDFEFVDVFTGGGSVAINVINLFQSSKIIVNDLDGYIYSFWNIICTKNKIDELLYLINKYKKPMMNDFEKLRHECNDPDISLSKRAFLGLFFNRTTFSGIFTSGPIGGYDQSGKYKINCRYNADKMCNMIKKLSNEFSSRKSECFCLDYKEIIEKYKRNENAILYLDPPYMKQGEQLYNHYFKLDEYRVMMEKLTDIKANWIISHDDNPDFIKLLDNFRNVDIIKVKDMAYTINSIKDKKRNEVLVIGRN